MSTVKAVVQEGRLLVEERLDYPDGTELEVWIDEMDADELAKLDASLERSWEDLQAGRMRPGEEILKEL